MPEPGVPARVWLITLVIAAFIVYGSLYPFDFRIPSDGPGAIVILLASWNARPGRGDFLANVLLYVPFGFFFLLGSRRTMGPVSAVLRAALAGAILSLCMELTQYYDTGRDTEATDLYANTLGTLAGALAALVAFSRLRLPVVREVSGCPASLVLAWLAYRLYPYVPTIDMHKYWHALHPLFFEPSLAGYDLFRKTATWLVLCVLVDAAVRGRRSVRLVLLFALAVPVAQVVIVDAELRFADLAGFGAAFAIWLGLLHWPLRVRAGLAGVVLCTYVVISRLEPFQFQSSGRSFGWIPFYSFLFGSLAVNTLSFLEKFFLYGSVLYLLGKASGGRRLPIAAFVAVLLLTTSWLQTFLPGRSAEITDAIMVVVIALVFALLPPDREPSPGSGQGGRVLD